MTELSQDQIILGAAKAAHNAAREIKALAGQPCPSWVDETDEQQFLEIEVTKSILGLPTSLQPDQQVQIGDVGLFVTVVRTFVGALGFGVLVQLNAPKFVTVEPDVPQEALDALIEAQDQEPLGTGIEQDNPEYDPEPFEELDPTDGPVTEPVEENDGGGDEPPRSNGD